ncbi:hypothetical protein ACTMTJ_42485 [Phytohabitans sp. LJ34]|uniref:hypothetical protein n=1 Tax=Phytohabitans sp. LJ34 TaxID=3452217 RepID=UPI003F8C50CA
MRNKPSPIRTSPLLSEEDRQFLAGHLTADTFLESARRRAAVQTVPITVSTSPTKAIAPIARQRPRTPISRLAPIHESTHDMKPR